MSFLLPATQAEEGKRNLLSGTFSQQDVERLLIQDDSWIPFPDYSDRAAWERIPEAKRKNYIAHAERYLNFAWTPVKATEYLEFSRSGNRIIMENPQNARRYALRSLALAELMEGRGRFMDDLVNGVFSFCEQGYWGLSACFYMYQRGKTKWDSNLGETNLPDIEDPIIDLWVAETGADLAWIWYMFHEAFDQISPVISQRLEQELRNRILEPYYSRMDYWWITGWGRGDSNNWNPWCNHNVMTTILLMEKDPAKKARGVYKSMTSVDVFFNGYGDDGACDEGPAYWNVAGGRAFDYLNMLNRALGGSVNLFQNELVKNIGRYMAKVYIGSGHYFVNFADASGKISPRGSLLYRYGEAIQDPSLASFGTWLMHRQNYDEAISGEPLGNVFDDLFLIDETWKKNPGAEPLYRESYLNDLQIAIAREQEGSNQGFYFAAKGGNNGESHNHNDVGSCIIHLNGEPVFVDAGVGTYTAQTFSADRYKIWSMQSNYHNLPVINGQGQLPGAKYTARNAEFVSNANTTLFSVDIAEAYPAEAAVKEWKRTYRLDRKKSLTITDQFVLQKNNGKTQIRFLTPLQCDLSRPGTVTLSNGEITLRMAYDARLLTPSIERQEIDDPKIVRVWGDHLNVLVFDCAPVQKAKTTFTLTH